MLWRGKATLAGLAFALGVAVWVAGFGDGSTAAPDVAAFPSELPRGASAEPPAVDPLEPALPVEPTPDPGARSVAKRRGGVVAVPPELLARIPVPLPGASSRTPKLRAAGADPARVPARERRVVEEVPVPAGMKDVTGPLRLEYTLDADLTEAIYEIFERGRIELGLAIVMSPETGDVLAYVGSNRARLPPDQVYPAASLVKVVTAAAALEKNPGVVSRPCRFVGNPYRLTPARIVPPRRGTEVSMKRALAMSNNQCFAQLAVGDIGALSLLGTFRRFGLLERPAPGHPAGEADDPHGNRYDLGKLGCGLAGLRITALHAARLGAVIAAGNVIEPRWLASVRDAKGNELRLPPRAVARRAVDAELATQLRRMMVDTTVSGTARRGFRGAHGRPLLRAMSVSGKTGSLTGKTPPGRYEWFVGVAPSERPKVAIAVLVVQSRRWHTTASQAAAEILNAVFCTKGVCKAEQADQWLSAGWGKPGA